MKKFVPAAFVIIAAALALLYLNKNTAEDTGTQALPRGRTVIPVSALAGGEPAQGSAGWSDDAPLTLIALDPDETLIGVFSADMDGDGQDDQIASVKHAGTQNIQLVVGIYNAGTAAYERAARIQTEISQVLTFACTAVDLTGNHRNELVYQGVRENGNSVLKAYAGSGTGAAFRLTAVAELESDGTIFIQQADRYDAYELSQTAGASFPIWVYRSDGKDQLQIQYNWNAAERKYTAVQQVRVDGSSIAATELAKIQDGTVASFADFLDGLWYKTDSDPEHLRYLFFDRPNNEIIFLQDDSEEVYSWVNSNLRRNGMYISTVNTSIQNLQRIFDISLLATDQVRVRIQDDVRMLITESNQWDGQYKKLGGVAPSRQAADTDSRLKDFVKGPAWYSASRVCYIFDGKKCNVSTDFFDLDQYYAPVFIGGKTYLQFKKGETSESLNGSYEFSFLQNDGSQAAEDMVLLRPAKLSPDRATLLDRDPLILTRGELPVRQNKAQPEMHEIVFLNR